MNYLEKDSFENGVQFAWDATSLNLAQTCPRKYYYRMIRGISPKSTSVHLLFGGIYAKALEHFYIYRAEGASIDEALVKVVREALVESWDRENGRPKSFEDAAKTRPNLIRTIIWYVEQFGEESEDGIKTHHLSSGKPAVELSFSLEFTDDIVYCGHLDRIVSMADRLYVMDQKTTGKAVSSYYFSFFSPDNQMSGYALAGKAVLQSPVSGVIIDAAQIAVNFSRFDRGITMRSKDQLDEWLANTINFLEYFQNLTRFAGDVAERWPMNPTACGNYGGCEFRVLCSRSKGIRENFIKSDFTEHNWDPIKAR